MNKPQSGPSEDNTAALREALAAIEHERWSDWQAWCHKILRENCPSPELEKVLERWDKQIATPYAELSEQEKNSDREQVDRYLPTLATYLEGADILPEKKGQWPNPSNSPNVDRFNKIARDYNEAIDTTAANITALIAELRGGK